MKYSDQLKHPKWQKRRLELLEAAGFKCQNCGDEEETLHIHHKYYQRGLMAWEYEDVAMCVLCEGCHDEVDECTRVFLDTIPAQEMVDLRNLAHQICRFKRHDLPVGAVAMLLEKKVDYWEKEDVENATTIT